MGPIVKVIVPKLLAFKIEQDVDLLPGKPILALSVQISTLNFTKIRNEEMLFWGIAECANLKKNFKSKKLVKWSKDEILSSFFYFTFFCKEKLQKKWNNFWFKLFQIDLLIDSELWENFE